MKGSTIKKRLKKLLQLLSRYDVPVVYVEDIADFLGCSREMVENEFGLLHEEEILNPVYNAHCDLCGHVMATYAFPDGPTVGLGIAECHWCMSQQKVLPKDLVSSWVVRKEPVGDEPDTEYDDTWTVISSRSYLRLAGKDDFVDEAGLAADSSCSDYF